MHLSAGPGRFWSARLRAWSRSAVLVCAALLLATIPAATVSAGTDEDTISPTPVDLGEPPAPMGDLQVPYGQMASFDDSALQLTLIAVDEDSRCPREVMCVWQGRAVVRLGAVLNGADQGQIALTTTVVPNKGPSSVDATVGPYTLRLIGLTPYPSVNRKAAPEQYVAILCVTRP